MNDTLAEKRWIKAEKTAWFLQGVPFVRFISVTGSLAYDMAKENSDIDIFVIAKTGRIWTARYFVTLFLRCIGQYNYINTTKRAGKICPNRFLADDYLVIHPQNRYHAQDYTQMVPLFDINGLYDKFIAKNKWMEKYGFFKPRRALLVVRSPLMRFLRSVSEFILRKNLGNWLEKILKNHQLKIIKRDFPSLNEPHSTIIASDREIRIHPRPR
ncbi:MAG: hypothetical protein M1338_03570 [Patescibacteria group bacterium]|nr:hypothetical protein [Patescibacteria group bacterium]